ETRMPGIYAAGDLATPFLPSVTLASSQGAMAGKRPFLTRLFGWGGGPRSVLTDSFAGGGRMSSVRDRYGEAFWRAHQEAWLQSELNQREYCEAYGIPIKAFDNWRVRFMAEPHPPARRCFIGE